MTNKSNFEITIWFTLTVHNVWNTVCKNIENRLSTKKDKKYYV